MKTSPIRSASGRKSAWTRKQQAAPPSNSNFSAPVPQPGGASVDLLDDDLTDGEALTNRKSNDEDATLNLQGCDPSCRLSCVTFVYGDVDVTVRPDREGGFFGSATSGSGW